MWEQKETYQLSFYGQALLIAFKEVQKAYPKSDPKLIAKEATDRANALNNLVTTNLPDNQFLSVWALSDCLKLLSLESEIACISRAHDRQELTKEKR